MARLLALTGALIAIALACASPATAAHVQCGDVITQDTTLDNDLVCAGDGLTVEAPDISLRLAGHSIAGSGSGTGVTLVWPGGVAIQGGTISNFGDGVYTDGGRGTSFREMRFEGNRVGVRCAYAPECLIEDSVFRDNDIEYGSLPLTAEIPSRR